jgi:cation:H+ antiporter
MSSGGATLAARSDAGGAAEASMESPELWGWLVLFAAAASLVVVAGIALARVGDRIATRTGLGGMLVGMVLVAGATSLPEIATDVSAAIEGAPDLAIAALLGSNMANMAILALIDLAHRGRVWPQVGIGHALVATIAIALTALAVLALVLPTGRAIGWIGIDSLVIAGGYVAAVAWLRRSRRSSRRSRDPSGEILAPIGWSGPRTTAGSLRTDLARFGVAALVILVAAPVLALSGKGIADTTGIGQTFVGTLLLAVATSMPELVASFAAIRIGAFDLAVGNLFGSNAFNMAIILAADAAYLPGPILAAVDPGLVVPGVGAILLMALALAAVVHGEPTRFHRFEPDAALVLGVYVLIVLAVWGA